MNDKVKIAIIIEKMVRDFPDLTYLEACMQYAEENDLDIQQMTKLIGTTLKEKLYSESIKTKCIKSPGNPISLNEFIK